MNNKRPLSVALWVSVLLMFLTGCGGGSSGTPAPILDTTPPVITLNGDNPINIIIGSSYNEPGASAVDDVDGTVSVSITGTVDTNTLGSYTLTYSASDTAGNTSTATRTVNVELPPDTTPPVITLIGDNPQIISTGTVYAELGATAVDDIDGDISDNISIDASAVNASVPGDYTVTYNVSDTAGNAAATQTRTLSVVDTTPPVITLIGNNPFEVIQGTNYVEPGASAIDNVDGDISGSISIDAAAVDTSVVGNYNVTYDVSDTAGNTATTQTRTVNVVASISFITTWKTDNVGATNDDQIKIGTQGAGYNYTVDWGDGNSDSNVSGDITHTYAAVGTYTVSIGGDFPQIYFGFSGFDNEKLLTIEQWGNNHWQSMYQAFLKCINVVSNASDAPNLSQVTTMRRMFRDADAFNQDISSWDVSTVTNISSMFLSANTFNQNIGSWDVSAVTRMDSMFENANTFNQDIGNWDVSAVTDLSRMFFSANAFNQDIGNWDVSAVTDLSRMFFSASTFNQDIGSWDVSAVTDMGSMFYDADTFNQDISSWDVSTVTNMSQMFSFASAFNQNIGNWDVSAVTYMSQMFYRANAFNQDIGSWDVSFVSDMNNMFNDADTFNQNLSNWDVSSVTDMDFMFNNASSFTNQDLSGWEVINVPNDRHDDFFTGAGTGNIEPLWQP